MWYSANRAGAHRAFLGRLLPVRGQNARQELLHFCLPLWPKCQGIHGHHTLDQLPLADVHNLLGRFTTPDPFRQEHNPYQGMGNNPVSNIDPTGGAYTGYTAFINSEVDALQRAYAVGYQWNEEMSRYKEALLFAPTGSGKVNFDGLEVNASAAMSMVRTNTNKYFSFTVSSGLRTFYLASDGHGNVVSTLTLQEAVKYSSYVHVTLGKSVQENAKTIEEAIVKAEAEGKVIYIEGIGELDQYKASYRGEKRHLLGYSLNGQYNANPSFGEGIISWYTKVPMSTTRCDCGPEGSYAHVSSPENRTLEKTINQPLSNHRTVDGRNIFRRIPPSF